MFCFTTLAHIHWITIHNIRYTHYLFKHPDYSFRIKRCKAVSVNHQVFVGGNPSLQIQTSKLKSPKLNAPLTFNTDHHLDSNSRC